MSDTCENERQRQSLLQRGRPDVMICRDCYANYGGAPGTVLCPLHEATAELYSTLKALLETVEAADNDDVVVRAAQAAIRKAEAR